MASESHQRAEKALEALADAVQDQDAFSVLCHFVDEHGDDTLEDVIRQELCGSSWCRCNAQKIAEAVRMHLQARVEDL